MKKLLYIVLFVPLLVLGQTTTENYTISKTYKKPTTTPVVGNDKAEVSTAIQYYDGLGRLKQSIAVAAGGNTISQNQVPIDWSSNTGSTNFYNKNGTDAENKIINSTTPFGTRDLIWACIPDATRNNDGGWNTDFFTIDNTKTYRYAVWVKRTGSQNGTTYHGIQNVDNVSDGSGNPNNPYFWYGDLPKLNTWYLLVGVVHPHFYKGQTTNISGVYDVNGNKVLDGEEYKWRVNNTQTRLRSYLFYCTDTNVRQYFWSPLFQEMDGSELSIDDIVSREETLTGISTVKDIVTHYEYDEFGRQRKEYLPLTHGNNDLTIRTGDVALAAQTYYGQKYAADFAGVSLPSEINAYSEKTFDNSPLNRVLQQAAPGTDWKLGNGHEIGFEYQTNTATEVKLYGVSTVLSNNTYIPTLTGGAIHYAKGELYKTITKDENWVSGNDHTTQEFKNKQGQVILKRTFNNNAPHDTFYVYDDFGNLTYVMPPKTEANTNKPTQLELNELCYQYRYDQRNRLIEKKIPGKGWEYIVYDKLDRPVLTQDALQRTHKNWLITKYDVFGRVAYTGIRTNMNYSRVDLQNLANGSNYTTYENKQSSPLSIGGTTIYYTSSSLPSGISKIHTVAYYDDYVDLPTELGSTITTTYGVTSTINTKGLPTVGKVRVLETNNWITTVTYYDAKARPIYMYSYNEYLQTTDIVESKLDGFTGKVLETTTTHKKTGQDDIVTVDRFEYDHMDRLVSQNQQINNQVSNRIVKNKYDDLGQLESKLIGNGTTGGYKDVTSGIAISNNEITKTGATSWSDGLATLGSFTGDGYVEFVTLQKNKNLMVGLSSDNSSASYTTIDYAIYLRSNGKVSVYESGSSKGGYFRDYKIGDVFKVERIVDMIYYKKNDEVFYTSKTSSSGSLLGDVSLYHSGAKIKDAKIVDNSKGLQKVDYTYNVRGWLKNINQDIHNDNDLFNFSLNYNRPNSGTALYNGNISQTIWNTANEDQRVKTYSYSYDALNRITSGVDSADSHNLSEVSYDKNGNITFLIREGYLNGNTTGFSTMDELVYTYDTGNKLKSVFDDGDKEDGFIDGNTSGDDYMYDVNGNMIFDKNKKITKIKYNHLNLPTSVDIGSGTIAYTYDASGVKLSKHVVTPNAGSGSITQYAGNYIYQVNRSGSNLQFFNHPEGYVTTDNTGDFKYIYQYKDHLGNIRVSYTDTDEELINDSFSTTISLWNSQGSVLSHENGKLKVTSTALWSGTNRRVANLQPGDKVILTASIDKGSTQKVELAVSKFYGSEYLGVDNLIALKQGGNTYEYIVPEGVSDVQFKFFKNVNDGVQTYFYIDDFKAHLKRLEIVEESNYYPFGLKHKGYNNVTSSLGNSTAQKKGFANEELEEELGKNTIAYQWRDYDPAIGRFNKIDRFAEKYQTLTTYHFTANNPVFFREIAGDSINVTHLQINNSAALNTLDSDLEAKTGLNVSTNANGNLEYEKEKGFLGIKRAKIKRDANGKKVGSRLARRKLRKAIKSKNTITVKDNTGGGNYVPGSRTNANDINFDISEINMLMGAASSDLNSSTVGPALVFLHELGHTQIGGSKEDPNKNFDKVPGQNVKVINRMRRQLGKNYGVRATYGATRVGGNSYMPFSQRTKQQLKKGVAPTIQNLKF